MRKRAYSQSGYRQKTYSRHDAAAQQRYSQTARKRRIAKQRRQLRRRKFFGTAAVLVIFTVLIGGVLKYGDLSFAKDGSLVVADRSPFASRETPRKQKKTTTFQDTGKTLKVKAKYGTISTKTFEYDKAQLGGSKDPVAELRAVLSDSNSYPKEMIDGLSSNPEILHFVAGYHTKKNEPIATKVGRSSIKRNKIPLILQYDQSWGYAPYGNSTVAISGCGPACVSMVAVGLTGNKKATPAAVAASAEKNGFYTADGTSWSLMTDGGKPFGVAGTQMKSITPSKLKHELQKGHPVILSMRPGDFTQTGHFIVLTGVSKSGKALVNDPYSVSRSQKEWSFDTLVEQSKSAWSMRKL